MGDRQTHGPQARLKGECLDAPHGGEGAHGLTTMGDKTDALSRTADGVDSLFTIAQSGDVGRRGEVRDARHSAPFDERKHATLFAAGPPPTIDVRDVTDLLKDLGEGGSDDPRVGEGGAATHVNATAIATAPGR